MCPDSLNVLADISVGDPWLRGKGGRFICEGTEGSTVVITRNTRSDKLLRDMSGKCLEKIEDAPEAILKVEGRRFKNNREAAVSEISCRTRNHQPVPDYGLAQNVDGGDIGGSFKGRGLFNTLHGKNLRGAYMTIVFSWPGRLFLRLNIIRKRLCGSKTT